MVSNLIIKQVIQLAKTREKSDYAFYEKYYPDGVVDVFDCRFNNTEEFLKKEQDDKALDEYLNSLSYENLLDLESIMYIGRGDADTNKSGEKQFASMRKYLEDLEGKKKEKWNVANQMHEKLPLADYLKEGSKLLNLF